MKQILVCLLIIVVGCDVKYQTSNDCHGLEMSCFEFGYTAAKEGWSRKEAREFVKTTILCPECGKALLELRKIQESFDRIDEKIKATPTTTP